VGGPAVTGGPAVAGGGVSGGWVGGLVGGVTKLQPFSRIAWPAGQFSGFRPIVVAISCP
jgi:hypothetical protein